MHVDEGVDWLYARVPEEDADFDTAWAAFKTFALIEFDEDEARPRDPGEDLVVLEVGPRGGGVRRQFALITADGGYVGTGMVHLDVGFDPPQELEWVNLSSEARSVATWAAAVEAHPVFDLLRGSIDWRFYDDGV